MTSPTMVASEVWRSRELLRNLVAKELKVRYKGSVLGFAWSLVTPLMMAAVFTVVFLTFLRIPFGNGHFTSFFLAGYLMWNYFATSVLSSAGSIISNGQLIKKVYFPRELIPFSLTLAQGVHMLLALLATTPIFVYYRGFHPEQIPLVIIGLLLLTLFTAGVSMLMGALTVRFRDLQEFLQVLMLAWFYMTPVIYSIENIRAVENGALYVRMIELNPMAQFATLFHRILYGVPLPPTDTVTPHPPPGMPSLELWVTCLLWGLLAFALGYLVFRREAVTFAKEV